MSTRKKENSTLKKCELILGLFEDMFPRPYLVQPHDKSSSKPKNTSTPQPFRFSTDKKKTVKSHSRNRSKSNSSFSSVYSKESRLDRIMKIKPSKCIFNQKIRSKPSLNASFSSSCSGRSNK